MKYCPNCGNELIDIAVICPACGVSVAPKNEIKDAPNFGYALLGFFIPLAGIIIYCCCHSKTPLSSRSALRGAILSIALRAILSAIWLLIVFIYMCFPLILVFIGGIMSAL